ncbi:MAG: hypothetical protein ACRECH_16250, partial [Nitrososphaerales archaeon]
MIKASAMEWRTIRRQVEHIVKQLEGPRRFSEIIVVTDSYEGPFARQYDSGDWTKIREALDLLVERGAIDRYVVSPSGEALRTVSSKWFGLFTTNARCENGQPTLATLYGFEQCKGDFILQVDSDCLIGRKDRNHDYMDEMLEVFSQDQRALTISIPIAANEKLPLTTSNAEGKWRTEVRCCVISKSRLEKLLPLPNSLNEEGILKLPWHRAVDLALKESGWQSYRGGDPKTFFIHIPNDRKFGFNAWYNIMKAVESGKVNSRQAGCVNLIGNVEEWLEGRDEDLVFVVRGRNVPPSKVRRCFNSLLAQQDQSFGVVAIDAASDNGMDEFLENVVGRKLGNRMTLYRNLEPATPIENIFVAVRKLCVSPNSIIALLDADDALIGKNVVCILKEIYAKGADVTVGSMLRTDKYAEYPVDFSHPRRKRGGNVWQHLRTFRKYLFDQIDEEDFKIEGKWLPHTEDWAYMLPIVEMAKHPVHITEPLYFYEPTGKSALSVI